MSYEPDKAHGTRARLFYGALKRAIAQDDGDRLRKAAETLLSLAAQGEPWAVKEIADRLDGKAAQSVAVSGDGEGGPIETSIKVTFG
jgi:hypothetical protein